MVREPRHRLEDWMRLILLNWVMISMAMFYSILFGAALGCLAALLGAAVVEGLGHDARFLRLFPSMGPGALLVIGGLIPGVFLCLLRQLRYHCGSGGYALALTRAGTLRAAAGLAGLALLLVLIAAGIFRPSPP